MPLKSEHNAGLDKARPSHTCVDLVAQAICALIGYDATTPARIMKWIAKRYQYYAVGLGAEGVGRIVYRLIDEC